MKKLLFSLLMLPVGLLMASCSNDDDLPDVKVTMDFGNAAVQDGVLYVAQTDVLMLNDIETQAIDSNKTAVLTNVTYFWNYVPTPSLTWSSLPLEIPIADMPLSSGGNNLLQMKATLLEVDKSIAYTTISIPIKVVATVEDFPEGLTPGDVQLVLQIGQSRQESSDK